MTDPVQKKERIRELWRWRHKQRRAHWNKSLNRWSSGGRGWEVILKSATKQPTDALRKENYSEKVSCPEVWKGWFQERYKKVYGDEDWSKKDFWVHMSMSIDRASREVEVHFTIDDVTDGIKSFTLNRAAGKDDVQAEFLKYLQVQEHLERLRELLGERLQGIGAPPESWKKPCTILLPKVARADMVNKFRPITVASTLSRLYDKMLLKLISP